MSDRIGMLHLHYRVGLAAVENALAPALTAGLDRAIAAGLGAALAPRLAALTGDERAVVVIRELHAPLRLAVDDCVLDSHVVELFSRACAEAMTTLLSTNPSTDTVMRFADETAFAGAFVAALLDGSAWRLWYFGAFHRYRRDGIGATVAALVREAGVAPLPLFGWLARHDQLPRLLVHLPPDEARGLLGHAEAPVAPARPAAADGNAVLLDAARRLLAQLAERPTPATVDKRIARFLAERPVGPDWRSRASLSAWVVQLLRFVLRLAPGDALDLPAADAGTLRVLLAGPLDWLDGAAIVDGLGARPQPGRTKPPAAGPAVPGGPRQLLSPRQQRLLGQLAHRLRERSLVLRDADTDTLFVTLMAAAASDMDADDAGGAAVATVVDLALRAWRPSAAPGHGGAAARGDPVAALRAAGPAALDLLAALRAIDDAAATPDDTGPMAGVLLLARAVNDLRLHALARQAGVPATPLMAALARLWAGVPIPASPVTALWCGAQEDSDDAALDDHGPAMAVLREALATLLHDRRMLDDAGAALAARDGAALAPLLPGCAVAAEVADIAALLLCGWGQWLPGMAASGPLFLLERTVRRGGCVTVGTQGLAVELDPAPFDVVLKMAGYLAPLGPVGWLGGRAVAFTVRSHARAAPP